MKKATGKDWNAWIRAIDRLGGAKMTHKEIARMLWDRELVTNGWWCQSVTVGYEYAKGRRVLGETADTGFEIGVRKTVAMPAAAWKRLVSPAGWKLWLGAKPKAISVWKPGVRMRFKWALKGWNRPSTIQLNVIPGGPKKCVIAIHQERLPNAAARAAMKKRWTLALEKIASLA